MDVKAAAKTDWMGLRLPWLLPAVSGSADFGAAKEERFVPVERASENGSSRVPNRELKAIPLLFVGHAEPCYA